MIQADNMLTEVYENNVRLHKVQALV